MRSSLIWVCTVCSDLSVPIFKIITVFELFLCISKERGAVVEWLEQLGCGAESHLKAGVQNDWKTHSVNPAVSGYHFQIRDR